MTDPDAPQTARQAAALVRQWLRLRSLGPYRVTARTISFSDLARASRIFVTIHGNMALAWSPVEWRQYEAMRRQAAGLGFNLETQSDWRTP